MNKTLQSLGVELPRDVTRSMVVAFDGLTPMDRFLVDTTDWLVGMKTEQNCLLVGKASPLPEGENADRIACNEANEGDICTHSGQV